MSDEPTIQSALTGEEWGAQRCDDLAWLERENGAGGFIRKGDMAIVSESGRVSYYGEESRHVIAALCLYQQPFGFTQDDVAALRELAAMELHERCCDTTWDIPFPCDCEAPARIAALKRLADRIAALLPPTP